MCQVRIVEGDLFAILCRIDRSRVSSRFADALAAQRSAPFIAQRGGGKDPNPVFASAIVDCFLEVLVCEISRVDEFLHHVDRLREVLTSTS